MERQHGSVLAVLGLLAQFEREVIIGRENPGIDEAQSRGKLRPYQRSRLLRAA